MILVQNKLSSSIWSNFQRYLKNAQHFKPGGPIFIYIGGEWTISPGSLTPGKHIYDLAEEFGGLLIYTEHRFYGETWPTK